jgi:GTP 3',8-cyclase
LRPGLVKIVGATAALRPRPKMSVTTNAVGLRRLATGLAAAGLDRVNVSLDTLRPDRYLRLTRRDRIDDVLAGLRAADAAGLRPVKLNAVLMRGINDDEAAELLAFALEHGYELRFIEQMPLDAQHAWNRDQMVAGEEILAQLRAAFSLSPNPRDRGAAPAETWLVDGYVNSLGEPAKVGVIASVTQPFCGACDRTRLTADGQVRNCLFGQEETDLRGLLRSGADDEQVADAWRVAMWGKRAGHGIDDPTFLQPARPMSAMGG